MLLYIDVIIAERERERAHALMVSVCYFMFAAVF